MGFFFTDNSTSSSGKKLKFNDMRGLLNRISILNSKDKEYVLGKFSEHKTDDINKQEAEKILKDLSYDEGDGVTTEKTLAIKRALMAHFNPSEEDHGE